MTVQREHYKTIRENREHPVGGGKIFQFRPHKPPTGCVPINEFTGLNFL